MSFRTQAEAQVIAYSNAVNALVIGNYSMGFTNPGMTAMPMYVIFEAITITGTATLQPTLSCGITSPNFTDIETANSTANLKTLNGIGRANVGGFNNLTIAPNSQVFCRVSVAGTGASVYTCRMCIMGVYF